MRRLVFPIGELSHEILDRELGCIFRLSLRDEYEIFMRICTIIIFLDLFFKAIRLSVLLIDIVLYFLKFFITQSWLFSVNDLSIGGYE